MSRPSRVADTSIDLEIALQELVRAKVEVRNTPADATALELQRAMADPLGRVELIRRTMAGILERFGWRPYEADPEAVGSGRPLNGTRRKAIAHRRARQ